MKFWTKSLMARLVSYILLLSLVAVSVVPIVTFFLAREALKQSVYDRLHVAAALKENELNRWINDNRQDVLFIAQSPELLNQVGQLFANPEGSANFVSTHENISSYFAGILRNKSSLAEIFILTDVGGKILLSTEKTQEGEYRVSDTYFVQGRLGTYIQNVYPSPVTGKTTMTISTPLYDDAGKRLGVLAVHLNLDRLNEIILERTGLGQSGETYLVDRFNTFVSEARTGEQAFPRGVHTKGINAAIQGLEGADTYENYNNVPVIGVYQWIGERELALLAEISQEEAFAPARQLFLAMLAASLLAVAALSVAAFLTARQIARPILAITDASRSITAGNLDATAPIMTSDELGVLATTFNSMTSQIRDLVGSLEKRVAERTHELQRRTQFLEAAARVGRAATTTLNVEQLTREIVNVIREQFDLYYVGLFLADADNEWAVLAAGTGEAGQAMLARGHRIKIGEGMIGWSIANARPRIALEAGQDAVRLASAELPLTRSEAAIPLRSRGKVPGAITVQSDRANDFEEAMITALQTMADQVGVALDNARLYMEGQQTLETTRRLTGELTRKAWAETLHAQPFQGFTSSVGQAVMPASGAWKPEMNTAFESGDADFSAPQTIALPVKIRDLVIGAVRLRKRETDAEWSPEDVRLVKTLTEQLGVALDSARLYSETQRRAQREHLLSDITSRVRASTNVNTILQTAIQELAEALQVGNAAIHLKGSDGEQAHE